MLNSAALRNLIFLAVISLMLSACTGQQVSKTSFVSNGRDTIQTYLYLPEQGKVPYPVVIDLHGCNGIWQKRTSQWVPRLTAQGFAVLQIDSFGSRGAGNICDDVFKVAPILRVLDVAAAIPFVERNLLLDKERMFLMGMSHGGTTTLLINTHKNRIFSRLKGAIAYYPYCPGILPVLNTDLLILTGGLDRWTPAELCRDMHVIDDNGHSFDLVVYPDAYHTFDIHGTDDNYLGHRILYDEEAAQDSFNRVQEFLEQR